MTTTLLLLRHAQAQGHESGQPRLLSGWHDVLLSPIGHEEAARLARRLRLEDLACIYSSPSSRAMQTAQAIAESTGLPVTPIPQLKEIYCGEVEGLTLEHVQRAYGSHWRANLRQDDPEFRWPGGESYREFHTRCLAGIEQIAARHRGQRVAVVTHAGAICQLIGHIRGTSPARWDSYRPANASVTVLEWHDGSGTLLTFDDRAHLRDPHATMRTKHPP